MCDGGHALNPTDITEIGLNRGPCFGRCPIFKVTLSRSGSYLYKGEHFVEPVGERSGRFPAYLFNRLAEVCCDIGIPELEGPYPSDIEDGAYTIITLRHAGGLKEVRDEGGGRMPARMWAFAVVVEHAMREAFEIEDRGAPRRGGTARTTQG
jgi:hypothetical protein